MPAYTIVTTSATQGADAVEMSMLADDFVNESEVLGYSRRMAEEMLGMAHQLSLDFDYSNVSFYEGDLVDEQVDTEHPALVGVWLLDEDGAAYVTAEDFRRDAEEGDAA